MWKSTLFDTSKLTLELRDVIAGGVDIWAFDYPSYYQGAEKAAFEKKVIDHYYFRQIGQETVGRFLHVFRTKVREIMPYYVDMYKTVEIMQGIEDPFGNVDIVETFEQESTGTASGQETGSASGNETYNREDTRSSSEDREHRFSNTPQGSIENLNSYMTEASTDKLVGSESLEANSSSNQSSESSSSTSSESAGTVKHTLTRKGNQGVNTYAHDMIEFRQSILNVDMMIINELNELFLGIY